MCQACVDAVQEIYPDCPEDMIGDFLFAATCFPFGAPEIVREQLIDAKDKGAKTWLDALAYSNEELSRAMADPIDIKPYIEDETYITESPGS